MDSTRSRVDVEYVRELLARLAEIDSIPLSQMDLFEGGEKIELTPEIIEDWRFVGMSNRAFIEMEFWKNTDFHEFEEVGSVSEFSQ